MINANLEPIIRWTLAFLILIFGANGIWHFIPTPEHPPKAERFRQSLLDTAYMLPLWKGTELVGALLLLFNVAVPLALILLAPILINIFFFHLFLSPRGLWLAVVLMICETCLILVHRHAYLSLI